MNDDDDIPTSEGCLRCKQDDDHEVLLLCEACNNEYHTYCLDPPLKSVPDGDWFCDRCRPLHSLSKEDGLDDLVAALPPQYTSRFGEIVWAAGGNGFGWWPSCIYDPRLSGGRARKIALKNLGKKHLVYFFGCHDTPFTVLPDSRLTQWDWGMLENYDAGKAAKAYGKNRAMMFEQALQIAHMEKDKPVEFRMDWNHEDDPSSNKNQSTTTPRRNETKKKDKKPTSQGKTDKDKPSKEIIDKENPKKKQKIEKTNVTDIQDTLISPDKFDSTRGFTERCYCKILRSTTIPSEYDERSYSDIASECVNVGFMSIDKPDVYTFADLREKIKEDLDEDCISSTEWKFFIPKFGPVSLKQEIKLGDLFQFLLEIFDKSELGDGSRLNPIRVIILDSTTMS